MCVFVWLFVLLARGEKKKKKRNLRKYVWYLKKVNGRQEDKETLILCGWRGGEKYGLYPHHDPLMNV